MNWYETLVLCTDLSIGTIKTSRTNWYGTKLSSLALRYGFAMKTSTHLITLATTTEKLLNKLNFKFAPCIANTHTSIYIFLKRNDMSITILQHFYNKS